MAGNPIESELRTSKMADGSYHVKNFTHNHFVKIKKKIKVAYRCEMARNAIESEFQTSKMVAGDHFVTFFKKIARNAVKSDFRTFKKFTKIKIVKWFLDIQNGYRRPFFKKHLQKKLR